MFFGGGLGRHGDGAALAWFQPQTLQEATHLGQPAAEPRPLFDHLLSFVDGVRRVLVEVFLQGDALFVQLADRPLVGAAAETVQATRQVVREVTLHTAA